MIDPAWVALSLSKHIGSKTLQTLLHHFGHDTRAILSAEISQLRQVPGVGPVIAREIKAINLEQIEQAIDRWQQSGIVILTPDHSRYPSRLRTLDDRPATLFVRGIWTSPQKAYAVVGTRDPSPQSREIAQRLGFELAGRGFTVVSGLAVGIDTEAHHGTLAAPDGYTLAVLGSGVLNVYPPDNHGLVEAVIRRGALVCEVHPQASVNSPSLVARNRIISGLSEGVIVVETEYDGGAMHAARFAKLQGRSVYAVENSASGNRALIADGAVPIPADLSNLPF